MCPLRASVMISLVALSQVYSFSFHPQPRWHAVRGLHPLRPKLFIIRSKVDDDGWSDLSPESIASQDASDNISKNKELEQLQNDLTAKRKATDSSYASGTDSNATERDLFIPIFTLVAVAGFTGLYGYEMLRLYSRGELYLPWEQ